MSKNIKFFLTSFVASFFLFNVVNIFGSDIRKFLLWPEPSVFRATMAPMDFQDEKKSEASPENPPPPPELELELGAKAAISVLISPNGEEKIILEKNSEEILPIASLTKLMNAYIVLDNYDLSQIIEISKATVLQEGDFGNLKVGENLSIENLLYIMLIESSNDAAYGLAELIGQKSFVKLMNIETKYLEMKNTHFNDSMGISSENKSTVKDLLALTKILLEKPLIWEILSRPEFKLKYPDGVLHHILHNTNEFLTEREIKTEKEIDFEILGGKTGYTYEANGCFLLVLDIPEKGKMINIILGSEDRFGEMEKMINWAANHF